jgi:hypothetical protein
MSHFYVQRVGFYEAGIKSMSGLEREKLKTKGKTVRDLIPLSLLLLLVIC